MNTKALLAVIVLAAMAGGIYAMRPTAPQTAPADAASAAPAVGDAIVSVTVPELSPLAQIGATGFANVCARCHGDNAAGREGAGPPLVHQIYVRGHHGDAAFHNAVANGVPAHHWPFGNMPPQSGLTTADVDAIVIYVRELQRANGIL